MCIEVYDRSPASATEAGEGVRLPFSPIPEELRAHHSLGPFMGSHFISTNNEIGSPAPSAEPTDA